MEITESVKKVLQEVIVPELGKIKEENHEILAILKLTNKRLDDVNAHLADQSRRIDDTNKRVDDLRSDLTQRIDDVRSELTQKMANIHADLIHRLDANNARIDQFFLTSVTKAEYIALDRRVDRLELDIDQFRQQLAA